MLQPHWDTLRLFHRHRYDIRRYAILFRLLEAVVFTPLAALLGQMLSGEAVVDSTDLVRFFLSPRGLLTTGVAGILLLGIRLLEQTGLTVIVLGAFVDRRVTVPEALRVVALRLPRLLQASAWILLAAIGLCIPALAVTGWQAHALLARHDINYYLAEHPPEFLTALAIVAAVVVPTLLTAVWLAVRWRCVVPVIVFEAVTARGALAASARLTRSAWRRTSFAWAITELLILVLGLLAAELGHLCGQVLLLTIPRDSAAPLWLLAVLLTTRTFLTSLVTIPGPCLAAGVFASLYRDFRRVADPQWTPAAELGAAPASGGVWSTAGNRLLAVLPLLMLTAAFASSVIALNEIDQHHAVAVTAHRGGTLRSIENTLESIDEAVADGAQFAEIDVQMSRDQVLVVMHDSDFSRQGNVASKVWELDYAEIAKIPLGNSRDPAIAPSRAPRLEEVLERARGRIRLNIELKYYGDNQPGLAGRVVAAVRAAGMVDQVVIQSLHLAGLAEAREIASEIPTGYLFSVNARHPDRLDVDFLSVHLTRVNRAFVKAAHRRKQEVHVWTVDKPSDMQKLIYLGVDNLITNQPALALEYTRAFDHLTPTERALVRVRSWLTE